MAKPKAPRLMKATRRAIWKKKEKFPKLKIAEIAAQFNVTYEQAREAINAGRNGELDGDTTRKQRRAPAAPGTGDAMFTQLYEQALADIVASKVAGVELMSVMQIAANIRKTVQQISLQSHLKRVDAEIVEIIIRKFMPEATSDDCIRIYREALAEWNTLS